MIEPKDSQNFYSEKIKSQDQALEIVEGMRRRGKRIGLCIGAFDLLHAGHMAHLRSAKTLCDFLVVGITKDQFLRKAKGEDRPIYNAQIRTYSISQLECTDLVFVRDHPTAVEVIHSLRPDLYIKGPDYRDRDTPGIINERKAIAAIGGEMKYTSDEKISTTEIIDCIKK